MEELVVDEADKMFEMGFLEQVKVVFKACESEKCSKYLFSATM